MQRTVHRGDVKKNLRPIFFRNSTVHTLIQTLHLFAWLQFGALVIIGPTGPEELTGQRCGRTESRTANSGIAVYRALKGVIGRYPGRAQGPSQFS